MSCPPDQTFINKRCISNACILNQKECSDKGTCTENACKCIRKSAGEFCENCADGFGLSERGNCTSVNCLENGIICSKKGTCLKDKCNCHLQTEGPLCGTCRAGYAKEMKRGTCVVGACVLEGVQCSDRGRCTRKGICVCEKNFEGQLCEKCVQGFELDREHGQCVEESCMRGGVQCSGNGKCVSQGCKCENSFSGDLCQCGEGMRQKDSTDQTCLKDNCQSSNGECNKLGTCALKNDEFVCDSCGQSIFNDPNKGCAECIQGGQIIDQKLLICTGTNCIEPTNQQICNNSGKCVITVGTIQCECTEGLAGPSCGVCANDENMITLECKQCKENYEVQNGKCMIANCFQEGIECSGNGSCDTVLNQCECTNSSYLVNTKCSKCANKNADPTKNCYCTELYIGEKCDECKADKYLDPTNCRTCINQFQQIAGKCQPKNCFQDGTTECYGHGKCNIEKMKCDCINSRFSANCQQCLSINADISYLCLDCLTGYSMIEEMCYFSDCGEGQVFDTGSRQCEVMQQEGQLSVGGVIGIAVGVVLLLVGVVIVVVIMCVKKDQKNKIALTESLIKTKGDEISGFPSVSSHQCQ